MVNDSRSVTGHSTASSDEKKNVDKEEAFLSRLSDTGFIVGEKLNFDTTEGSSELYIAQIDTNLPGAGNSSPELQPVARLQFTVSRQAHLSPVRRNTLLKGWHVDAQQLKRFIWNADYVAHRPFPLPGIVPLDSLENIMNEFTEAFQEYVATVNHFSVTPAQTLLPFFLSHTPPDIAATAVKHNLASDSAIVLLAKHGRITLDNLERQPSAPEEWLEALLIPGSISTELNELIPAKLRR